MADHAATVAAVGSGLFLIVALGLCWLKRNSLRWLLAVNVVVWSIAIGGGGFLYLNRHSLWMALGMPATSTKPERQK